VRYFNLECEQHWRKNGWPCYSSLSCHCFVILGTVWCWAISLSYTLFMWTYVFQCHVILSWLFLFHDKLSIFFFFLAMEYLQIYGLNWLSYTKWSVMIAWRTSLLMAWSSKKYDFHIKIEIQFCDHLQDHGHNFALPFLSNDISNKKKKKIVQLALFIYIQNMNLRSNKVLIFYNITITTLINGSATYITSTSMPMPIGYNNKRMLKTLQHKHYFTALVHLHYDYISLNPLKSNYISSIYIYIYIY